MERSSAKPAILILSHVTNELVEEHFRQIKNECSQHFDVISLCDNTSGVFDDKKNRSDYFLFSIEQLAGLDYPGKAPKYSDQMRRSNPYHKDFNFRPGSTDLPPLLFFRQRPDHPYYWVVEYDVRYSGSWLEFFSLFAECDADLLGTTLTRYRTIPNWYHWNSLDLFHDPVDRNQYIRGFFPVYRLSGRALATLDARYRTGVSGHYECLVPSVLHQAGLRLEDIGGDGEFVRPENVNRFYSNTPTTKTLSPGTFVFRPARRRPGKLPNKLWHPVKQIPAWRFALDRTKEALKRHVLNVPP